MGRRHPDHPPARIRAAGFTLLEVVLAVGVFALVAAAGYGALQALATAAAASRDRGRELETKQMVLTVLAQDLGQAIARPVRRAGGSAEPALGGDTTHLALTRGGWDNPPGTMGSTLKRIEWGFDGTRLERRLWPVTDPAGRNAPQTDLALEDITTLRWRYLDRQRHWLDRWPPPDGTALPRAIEIVFENRRGDRFRRLIEVAP